MTEGFFIGLAVGIVTAWFLYWRVAKLAAKIGFVKESVWRDAFSRATYAGLIGMREQINKEIARRSAP